MKLSKKLAYPAVVFALCVCGYQTSQARDWDRDSNYNSVTYWDGYGNKLNKDRPVYNNEVTYNTFPRGAKVVGGANYTIRGKYDDPMSEKLVNIGEKIQEKKNETVQRYDTKVSAIIDNEVEKTLNRIEGAIDSPTHGYSHPSAQPHNVAGFHHGGVIASNVAPAHLSHDYREKNKKSSAYIGGSVNYGMFHGKYHHIKNGLGWSGLIGLTALDTDVSAELGFNYSQYDRDRYSRQNFRYSSYVNFDYMKEYSGSVNVRYHLLRSSSLRPSFGLMASYKYKTYQTNRYRNRLHEDDTFNAIDWGLSAGLDFLVSDRMSFGVDYKYMLNLHDDQFDGHNNRRVNMYGSHYSEKPDLNYMLLNFTTKLFF